MKIQARQKPPEHPVYEATEVQSTDLEALVQWLYSPNLPQDMSLSLDGLLIRFRSKVDREYYALGMAQALQLLATTEPKA